MMSLATSRITRHTAMTLHFQNGARLNLRQQPLFLFGRANQEHPDVHTSRQHCSLQLLNQGNDKVLKLVSLSQCAPTQVYRANTSAPEILCTGQHALLKHNDRFSTGAGLELFRVDLQQGEPQRQQPIIQDFQPAGDSSQTQEQPQQQQQQRQVTRAHESVLRGDYSKVQEQQHQQQLQQQQQQRAMPQEDCVHIQQSALHTALPKQQQGPVEGLIDVVCQSLPLIDIGIHGNDSQQAKGQKLQMNEVRPAQNPLQETQGKHVWKDGNDAVCQPLSSSSQQEKGLVHELQPHELQPAQSPLHVAQREHECEGEDLLPQSKRQRASSSPATKPANAASTEGASAGTEAAASAAAAGNEAPSAVGPRQSPYAAGSGAGHAAPVMLILMGVNGSGKSTFSQALAQTSYMPFVRVNQDTISSKGTPGSRKQCVAAAQRALRSGKSVIIDRCNLNADQRKDFVNLAAQLKAPIHAVVLDLPFETCLSRAMARTNHPSGKHGKEVVPIVYSMRREMMNGTVPSAMEGFQSVSICKTDEEVAATLQTWQRYGTGPGSGSPGGTMEQPYQPHSPAAAQHEQQQQPHPVAGESSVSLPGSSGAAATAAATATTGGAAALVPSEGAPNNSGRSSRGPGSSGGNIQAGGSAKKGKKPPPAASAASVNLMRSLFSRPHQAEPQGATASTPDAPCSSSPAVLSASEACQPSPSAPPHPLGRSHSDSAAATAAAAAATGAALGGVHGSRAAPAAAVTAPPLPSPQPQVPTQPPRPHRVWNHYQQALYYMAQDTSKIDRRAQKDVHVDDLCIRIRDIYPKSHYHALVVAREPGLDSVEDLQPKHLPLLDHMRHVAMQYLLQCQQQHPQQQRLVFRLGFHSIPSCRQLHLHVVSQDLCGANMKKKDHYQRFTTPFFITLDEVEKQLQEHGHVACDQAQAHAFLGAPLKCHRCGKGEAHFPRLKEHLASCTALFTGPGAVHV